MGSNLRRPVADLIAEALVNAGVRRIYTVPGESFLPLLEAFDKHPDLRVISARHEGGAAFMAEADARLTGVPTVVMGTRAVGAANMAIGLHTALQGSTPMLAFIGQVDSHFLGREAFQEIDLAHFLQEVTVSAARPGTPDGTVRAVSQALARCTAGRPGPAAIVVFPDLLDVVATPIPLFLPSQTRSCACEEDIVTIVEMIDRAARPVAIVGELAEHTVLTTFAEKCGVGIYTAFRRQDSFPNDNEHYLGHLTVNTSQEIVASLEDADLVLVLGERLDEITTQSFKYPRAGQTVIHVYPDPSVLGRHQPADLAIAAEPMAVCSRVTAVAGQSARSPWWRSKHAAYLMAAEAAGQAGPDDKLHPGRAIRAVQAAAPEDTIVCSDAGNFSVFLHRQWIFRHPHTQAAPVSGAMGYGVPGAIGAKLAYPAASVLAVAGDGGFLMTATEIETAHRFNLDIKILVLQNNLYGTIAMHQAHAGYSWENACRIGDVDLAGLARSLGARTIECRTDAELEPAARSLFSEPGLSVMVVHTDPDIILPGITLSSLKKATI